MLLILFLYEISILYMGASIRGTYEPLPWTYCGKNSKNIIFVLLIYQKIFKYTYSISKLLPYTSLILGEWWGANENCTAPDPKTGIRPTSHVGMER